MVQSDEAKRLFDQGRDAYRAGEYEEALVMLGKARDLFAQAGDRSEEAEALGSMGVIHIQEENWETAQHLLDEALAICVEAGDRSNEGKVLGNLGMMYARQGDEEKAAESFAQAIAIFRETGERDYEKATARQMSKLGLKKGKLLEALGDYQESLTGEEEAHGVQKVAQTFFRLLGRVTGGGSLPEAEEPDEEDVVDVTPGSDKQ